MTRACVLTLLMALPAAAEPMTAADFEAYSSGKTLSYAVGGEIYGAEQYMPGRRVLWAFKGEECRKGFWYEEAAQICFVYDDEGAPQCWTFFQDAGGLRARFQNDPEGTELSEVAQTPNPLICAGPDVGV